MSELQQQLNVETILAVPEFEELLELSIDTCLRSRDNYERHLRDLLSEHKDAKRDPVLEKLGLWGLREAIEFKDGELHFLTRNKEIVVDREMHTQADPVIQLQIEAFGKALLDDAFQNLGADAPMKVEEMRNSEDKDEILEIYGWLGLRLFAMEAGISDEEALKRLRREQKRLDDFALFEHGCRFAGYTPAKRYD